MSRVVIIVLSASAVLGALAILGWPRSDEPPCNALRWNVELCLADQALQYTPPPGASWQLRPPPEHQ